MGRCRTVLGGLNPHESIVGFNFTRDCSVYNFECINLRQVSQLTLYSFVTIVLYHHVYFLPCE